MGVNMAGSCIVDNDVVCAAARQEILRRYYTALCDRRRGQGSDEIVYKLELLMKQACITEDIRPVIAAAEKRAEETGEPGRRHPAARRGHRHRKDQRAHGGVLCRFAQRPEGAGGHRQAGPSHLSGGHRAIQSVKVRHLGSHNPRLHSDEILIALAISAATDPMASPGTGQPVRPGGTVRHHSSVILSSADSTVSPEAGARLTCSPATRPTGSTTNKPPPAAS